MDCEFLFPDLVVRGTRIMRAMIDSAEEAGIGVKVTGTYQGNSELLMTWGLGHLGRRTGIDTHLAKGGRVIGFDMGYWDRAESMRLTIDHDHPRELPEVPADRWEAAGIELRNDHDPKGPIILVGLGRKTRKQFGYAGLAWEIRKLAAIRAAYPGRPILYRPKKMERLQGIRSLDGPIEQAIKGASLLVCKHSNVAIDACIAGIPVVCEDGAAATLYGNDLSNPVVPSPDQRRDFLTRLAYWNYRPDEAALAWAFIKQVMAR